MFRFICFLLNRTYEPCKGCEVLRQQLLIANEEKRDLVKTLLDIVKPKVVESTPVELEPTAPKYVTFTRRRAALEESARERARIIKESKFVAVEDKPRIQSTNELESELDIKEAI